MAYINGKEVLAVHTSTYEKGDSVFVRYSQYEDGTAFTEHWGEGQEYVGIATAKEAPTDKKMYQWHPMTGRSPAYVWSETYDPNKPVLGFEIDRLEIEEDGGNTLRLLEGAKVYNLYGDYRTWQPFEADGYNCEVWIHDDYVDAPFDEDGWFCGSITLNDTWLDWQDQYLEISRYLQ